ncbi:outer membrane protein [Tangfeifania diversioriginum]|uniref:Outer membrane protein n=1 Tax=Tangfeifania diversioriginum TaxID=1168035 RepID=A0A1M6F524_9BACT|nr:TolC family protein [Tangfeifania diversioriginum]SHI92834.1 outer membrane protein [Tangfeifania diversioriginum]
MNRIIILFTAVLFFGASTVSEAQEEWTLQKCIDYALENNIQIKRQELNTQYSRNQVNQARADRLPNLNAGASNNFSYGRSLNNDNVYENVNSTQLTGYVNSNITLFNGFTLQKTIEQSRLDLQAAIQDLEKTKDDIILNIAAAYLEILFAEELAQIAEAQIEVTSQQIDRTQKLIEAGSLARGALLEIEAQLAREELQLVNDKNRVKLAYLNLYQLLELPVEKSFEIKAPVLPEVKANVTMAHSFDVFSEAVKIRPEIEAARLRVESAKRQLDIVKGNRYPSLSFGANYNNQYYNIMNSDFEQLPFGEQLKSNSRYGFGFTLNIPIFNRFQVKNGVSNAKLQITDYEYQLQTSRNLLRKDIEQAYTNALAALNRYVSSEKAVESTREAFRYTEEKFNVGMVNSVEYNQSKNNLTTAQSELLQARYEYIFRAKILDFYNGVPIEL